MAASLSKRPKLPTPPASCGAEGALKMFNLVHSRINYNGTLVDTEGLPIIESYDSNVIVVRYEGFSVVGRDVTLNKVSL